MRMDIVFIILFFLYQGYSYAFPISSSSAVDILTITAGNNEDEIKYSHVKGDEITVAERKGAEAFFVDKEGRVFITNGYCSKIKVYKDGKYLYSITIPDEVEPMDIENNNEESGFYLLGREGEVVSYTYRGEIKNTTVAAVSANTGNVSEFDRKIKSICDRFIRDEKGRVCLLYDDGSYDTLENVVEKGFCTKNILNSMKKYKVEKFRNVDWDYKKFLGYDKRGNVYFSTTRVITNKVSQVAIDETVYKYSDFTRYSDTAKVIDSEDEMIVPNKYLYLTPSGNVFQMLSLKEEVKIIKLKMNKKDELNIRDKKKKLILKGESLAKKVDHSTAWLKKIKILFSKFPVITREEAMTRAKNIYDVRWTLDPEKNKQALVYAQKPIVVPGRISKIKKTKEIRGIPYCWGGFDGIENHSENAPWVNFKSAIDYGAAAGNISATELGYRKGTAGLDCSGFVSSVFKFQEKRKVLYIGTNLAQIIPWKKVKPMDMVFTTNGHIGFFLSMLEDGSGIRTVESFGEGNIIQKRCWKNIEKNNIVPAKYLKIKDTKEIKSKTREREMSSNKYAF